MWRSSRPASKNNVPRLYCVNLPQVSTSCGGCDRN
uniref:Uncharacterized protein n=1 Tax=Lepeophtheirus salmonis TaxID=72036 RepID=A0A0K2UUG5_LEPSM